MSSQRIEAIFVGASAGGVSAIQRLLNQLDPTFSLPIIVTQHIPSNATFDPALVFTAPTKAIVQEAEEKAQIEKCHVYFAPPGYHLLVERDRSFSLSQEEPVHHARPSIDVLFESAAYAYGNCACGILLTGANADGAKGLATLKREGAFIAIQDPHEAEISTMPSAGIAAVTADFVGTIAEIAARISAFNKEVQS